MVFHELLIPMIFSTGGDRAGNLGVVTVQFLMEQSKNINMVKNMNMTHHLKILTPLI